MKFIVRLPARRVLPLVDPGGEQVVVGAELAIPEDDVIGFVLGYTAAFGCHETLTVVDGPMPERHRRMQLLRSAQAVGLLTYLGIEDDEGAGREERAPS